MPTSTPFANLITFSRGSNATVVGPNGLVQWAPSNLLTYSEQFDNAAWSKYGVGATANTAVAPDGTQTADTITASAGANTHRLVGATSTLAAGFSCVHSVYVKAGTHNFIQIHDGASANYYANFNVLAGTVGDSANCTASITAVGSGWYRCSIAFTVAAANPIICVGLVTSASAARNESWTAAGTENVLLWGAQVEVGSTATTYNSTSVKNLLGFSEAFDNAAWTKSNASIVTGAQANPVNGLFNAQKLMENTASAVHYVQATGSGLSVPTTFSIYAKAAERSWLELETDIANTRVWFNLANGTIGTTGSAATPSITSIGNGWYRCSIRMTGSGNVYAVVTTADNVRTYTGDGNSGIFIYGAQLSDSASLDPYVPTPGAAPSSTAYYGPRFDYDPVTLQPRGILIEEQRTNLILTSTFATLAGSAGSQYPSGTGWSNLFNTGGTRTYVASSVFPGAQAVDIASVSAARNNIAFSFAPAASTTYTVSFYVESVSGVTGVVAYASGTLGTGGTSNSVTAPSATGRYSYTFTTGTSPGTVDLRFGIGASQNESGSIRISNVQCEAGAFATSYIPTVASTVTRSADVATMTGTNFSSWYNQNEGSFVVGAVTPTAGSYATYTSNGNETDYIGTRFGSSGTAFVTATGGALQANIGTTAGTAKIAAAYKINDFAVSVNGGTAATDTAGTVPPVNQMRLGAAFAGGSYVNGHVRSITYYPVRAADFQLQALTT